MKILVVYGNAEILGLTKHIFDRYNCDYAVNIDTAKEYDLVFSLHCKQIFPADLVKSVRCVNIHPGYNPFNRGMFPHVFSIINGLPAGATIHVMDEKIDNGRILARKKVEISQTDTSESLYNRILMAEVELLAYNIDDIVNDRIIGYITSKEPSNYNSMQDFKELCDIDPNQIGTFREFYDLLRALSHGKYKNAKIDNNHFKITML